MQEKPIALERIRECRETLASLESEVRSASQGGDMSGVVGALKAHHAALARAEASYLQHREWSADPDFAALPGGENKGEPPEGT